jgi:hypothetical protein
MKFFKDPIYPILLAYAVIAAFTIFYFNGTGDSGDSVTHYLFARYAPKHPELYFHHWAKPVFVLLASPFAQFGFNGMKFFNVLATLGTIFLTNRIAAKLKFPNAYAVGLMLIFSPMYFALTFSGLTEPLFALFLAGGIYLVLRKRYLTAALLISFLPFVRSEGLIILGVFAIYLAIKQKWKVLPFLAAGHIIYSFAGYFVHHDLLWVFRKIPYARLDSVYGRGEISHFAKQLFYILGLPAFVLFVLGIAGIIKDTIKKKISKEMLLLVFGGFTCFFVAHSLFWYLGIFGSMGLTRVFICVIPLMALIMLQGFNLLTEEIIPAKKNLPVIFKTLVLLYIIIFPFTKTRGALVFDRDLNLSGEQKAATEIAEYLKTNEAPLPRIAYESPYLAIALDIDPFDPKQRTDLNPENLKSLQPGELIVWDNHFALLDKGIKKEDLNTPFNSNIRITRINEEKASYEFVIYRRILPE